MPKDKTSKRIRFEEDYTATPSNAERVSQISENDNPDSGTLVDPSSLPRKRRKSSNSLSVTSRIAGLIMDSGTSFADRTCNNHLHLLSTSRYRYQRRNG